MNNRCGYSNSPAARAHYPVRAYGVRSAASAAPGRLQETLTATAVDLKKEAVSAVVSERDTKWKTAIMKQYTDMRAAFDANTAAQTALKTAQDNLKTATEETKVALQKIVTDATTIADKVASDLLIAQNKLRVVAAAAKAKNMPACPKVTSSRQNAEIGVGVSLGVLLLLFMVFFFMSRSKVKGLKRQLAKMGGGLELTPSAVTSKKV